jgi:hypothetical protein
VEYLVSRLLTPLCPFVQMTDTDVAFLLYYRPCPYDRHDLYLPSTPHPQMTMPLPMSKPLVALTDTLIIAPLSPDTGLSRGGVIIHLNFHFTSSTRQTRISHQVTREEE